VSKIHVCAPSNSAVDEILSRLACKGLLGVTSTDNKNGDMKKYLLRIGAVEYEASESIKAHTLDTRLQETLNDAKVYELKEQIAYCDELLMDLAAGHKLQWEKNRHRLALQKLVSQNIKKVKQFIAKVPSD